MRTLALVAHPRLSDAVEEDVSRALLDKIRCKMPFSGAATYLDLRGRRIYRTERIRTEATRLKSRS